jgi:hypothetical protein
MSKLSTKETRSAPVDIWTVIVLLSPCTLVALLMFFVVAMRYINYRERVALAQHGVFTPDESTFWERLSQRSPRGVLWAGVITTMSGLALFLGLLTIGIGWWLLGGLIPLFVGLGMIFLYFTGGHSQTQEESSESSPPPQEATGTETDL